MKPSRSKLRNRQRYRREKEKEKDEEKEEEIEDVTSYHVFGLGWSSDVKYNRKLIKVLNKAVDDNQEVLYEFMNRTDIALDQINEFIDSVMVMQANFLSLSSSVEKTFIEVRQAQKAAVLYQTLLPMVLEEKLGHMIYGFAYTHQSLPERSSVSPARTAGHGSSAIRSTNTGDKGGKRLLESQ